MFSLVALMCLYLGTSNLYDALSTPFGTWSVFHWLLFITGGGLLVVCYFCVRQAIRDLEEHKKKKQEQEQEQEWEPALDEEDKQERKQSLKEDGERKGKQKREPEREEEREREDERERDR